MEKTETTANENDLSVRDSSFWNGLLEMEAIFGLAPSGPDPCETPDSQAPPEPEPSEAADSRELTKSDTSKTVESLEPSIKYSTKAPDFSASAASSSKEKRPGKIHFPGRSFGDTFLDPISSRPPAEESRPHLRTAAYCRVSTASDEQDQSIQSQKEHYEYLVSLHEDWHLVSIYYEAGVSGTGSTKVLILPAKPAAAKGPACRAGCTVPAAAPTSGPQCTSLSSAISGYAVATVSARQTARRAVSWKKTFKISLPLL